MHPDDERRNARSLLVEEHECFGMKIAHRLMSEIIYHGYDELLLKLAAGGVFSRVSEDTTSRDSA